jgi:hypothetical protein
MMRVFIATALAAAAVQLAAEQRPRDPLFRGPFIADRLAVLVKPERQLPIEFEDARLYMGNGAPWAAWGNARLTVSVRSNTVRPITVHGVTLLVAVGPAEHGMFTFRMRGISTVYRSETAERIPQDGQFRPVTFAPRADDHYPGLLLLDRNTRVVFTLERLEADDLQVVFENPDATELLWEALGRPSFTSR